MDSIFLAGWGLFLCTWILLMENKISSPVEGDIQLNRYKFRFIDKGMKKKSF